MWSPYCLEYCTQKLFYERLVQKKNHVLEVVRGCENQRKREGGRERYLPWTKKQMPVRAHAHAHYYNFTRVKAAQL